MSLIDLSQGQVKVVGTFYDVLEPLGEGRFAEVYRAYDKSSSTDVALKIYRQFDERTHDLARAEAKVLASLGRQNSEFFPRYRRLLKHLIKNNNHPVLAMEYGFYSSPDGTRRCMSLEKVLPRVGSPAPVPPIPEFWEWAALRNWAIELAAAVKVLHDSSVIHRDIKPANILLKRQPSAERSGPMLLDFNTAARQDAPSSKGGTPRYLPPEVRDGRRREAGEADDLWGLAYTLWELFFGLETKVDASSPVHSLISAVPPVGLQELLFRSLSVRPEDRPQTAAEFLTALEGALRPVVATLPSALALPTEEWLDAKAELVGIRQLMVDELAGDGELPVPKELAEQVAVLFAWLSEEDTQSLDLIGDLVALGPRALPAVLQEAYKLDPDGPSFKEATRALTQLALLDQERAHRALQLYALSSNFGVRRMCRELCREIRYFPPALREALISEDQILLPIERVDLAELCLTLDSDQEEAILTLSKYMCREYLLDKNRYRDLKARVAERLATLDFPKKARLIVEDVKLRVWEDLPEYERLAPEDRAEAAKGLVQLLAEAFSAMGDEALDLLKSRVVVRPYPFRAFAAKLARRHPPTKAWLEKELAAHPDDRELRDVLGMRAESPKPIEQVLQSYLAAAETPDFNALRFLRSRQEAAELFQLLRRCLQAKPRRDVSQRIAELLKGFETRLRPQVVTIALDFWDQLYVSAPSTALDVLGDCHIENAGLRRRATETLRTELQRGGTHREEVRKTLDRILGG